MSADSFDREGLLRRVMGWRAAEARERSVRRDEQHLDPEGSLAAVAELGELNEHALAIADPVRVREEAQARQAWAKVRHHFGWQREEQPNFR